MKRSYSASELAALKLPNVSARTDNCSKFIMRVASETPDLVKPRDGRGGGFLVDIAALPKEAQDELARRHKAEEAHEEAGDLAQAEADAVEKAKRQITALCARHLTARQRRAMEARQAILLHIDADAHMSDCGRDRAIKKFIGAAKAGALDPEWAALVPRANDRSNGQVKVSRATLYQWFAAREQDGLIGLAPNSTLQERRAKIKFPEWLDGFLKFYAKPAKPSVEEALLEFSKTLPQGQAAPTAKAAHYWIKRLPALKQAKGRFGVLALKARKAYKLRDFMGLAPTSVYCADGKTFDAEVAHPIHGQPFRPELTTIVDVGTRKIVGWSASLDENADCVADALRMASVTDGIPAIFYTDRGPGYKNKRLGAETTGLLSRLGTTPMFALPYNSQAKGVIERINKIYTATAKAMPTYIGADMDKQAKLLAFKTTRRDLKEVGFSKILPRWEDFLADIQATIDAYNNRPHKSLPKIRDPQLCRDRHMNPNELWAQKSAGFEAVFPDADEIDDLFRPYVIRRTRRALVEWLDNSYFAIELEAYHGQEVVVCYDIREASKVWVRELEYRDEDRAPGRLIAIAQFNGHKTRFVPLSYEQDAMEKRVKAQLGRLDKKADVIKQGLNPALTYQAAPIIADFKKPDFPKDFAPAQKHGEDKSVSSSVGSVALGGERPFFRDDISFARWLSENPSKATASDKALLKELLTAHSSKELLRMSGLDLDALRSIARSAA